MAIVALLVYYLLFALFILMIVRMIMSWVGMFVPPLLDNAFSRLLASITEPVISPFRALLPSINGLDFFSFIFAIIMLQLMMSCISFCW